MIVPALPSRTGNGLAMRLGLFLEALTLVARTDLVLVPVAGAAGNDVPWLAERHIKVHCVERQPDTELSLLLRINDEQSRLQKFKGYGKPTSAGQLSSAGWRELAHHLSCEQYDIVHISRSYLLDALKFIRGRAVTTLDLDEDDLCAFASLERLEMRRGNHWAAAWYSQEGKACDQMIAGASAAVDVAFVAGMHEIRMLHRRHPRLHIEFQPNAVEVPRLRRLRHRRSLLFVGTLLYLPNCEGLLWFFDRVLPRIFARTRCRIVIVGRGAPCELRSAARRSGAQLEEQVEDLGPFYRRAAAAIAPLRGGGGTRIKLLEAASYGVPSIATSIAAAGLYTAAHPWGWIADTPQQFAEACIEALANPHEAISRGTAGRRHVTRHFARPRIVQRLARCFEEIVGGSTTLRRRSPR